MSIWRRLEGGERVRIPHDVAVRGGAAVEQWLQQQEHAPGDEAPAPDEPEPEGADEED